jgi:hypothetical protein
MYIFLVTFEHFSWFDKLIVKSVIRTPHNYTCITDGKKGDMNVIKAAIH